MVLDIQEHETWVRGLAKKFDRKGHDLKEDLFQEGMMGLMQAAERFDPDKHVSFRQYAHARVRGSMVDWLRRFLPGARPQNGPFRALFIDSLNREIDKTNRHGEALTVGQTIGSDGDVARRSFRMLCKTVLTTREFRIIEHVYFNGGTARDLRDEFGISESQISHNHTKAKEKLKEAIGNPEDMGDLECVVGGRRVRRMRT
ncbi:hypothetical protein LCGC14_2177130 [marine sediment metagenome]|uniref:RNA polymerase sigma-70 domain-containing protein n=1 Tax=marine sediment metagenome TaxID=412755 RepID=A0A0F9G0X3_9ZZZZ